MHFLRRSNPSTMFRLKKKYSFFLLLLCCRVIILPAQNSSLRTIALTENGKPVRITTIYKTRQGIIFTGTENGLYTFDGTPNFKKTLFADSIITSAVSAIFEDASGWLWIGCQNGSIAVKKSHKLTVYAPEEGTPAVAITCFAQDKQGNIWFGTNGEGIYYTTSKHLYNINDDEGLSDKNVHALSLTAAGEILAATDQGINICSIAGSKKNITTLTTTNGLPDNLVTCIEPAGNNRFWIGLQDNGYCLYDHTSKTFSKHSSNWQYGQVSTLLPTATALWIATESNGIFSQPLAASQTISSTAVHTFTSPITGFIQDNEDNFWLSAGNSMMRTNGEKLYMLPLFDKNQFTTTHAILADKDNNIWIGGNRAIYKYSAGGKAGKPQKITITELNANNAITYLYQDIHGTIWAGTMNKGIFLLNPVTGAYRRLSELPQPADRSILSISGNGSNVYICSLEGAVAASIAEPGNKYNFNSFSGIGNIGSSYVYAIFKDSRERLWFASFGKGLAVLDNGNYKTFSKTTGLASDIIYSITEDKKGNIWFSTGDAGIFKYDGNKFTGYTTAQGLSSMEISDIKTDALGNIVTVNKKGLDILNPETNTVSYINSNMGIDNVNTNDLGAVTQNNTGSVFFSTASGIGIYNAVKNISQQPLTIIENVRLFLEDQGPKPDSIFKHYQDNITFEFTGLYYSDPEQVQYQYKLENFNNDWITTKNHNAPFPKLPPGKYTFRVRSSLNEDFSHATEAVYSFVIEKPFWKTWWFLTLCAVVAAGLLYWYTRAREAAVKNVERLRQEKYQFQFEVLRNQVNPHFLFNSFNTLISTIEEDPKTAVSYVEQLSDFFRNIVTYRDKDVITLREETGLLQTYYYLQQKRYGINLQLVIRLSEKESAETFIPPLTLQLLMENAIKHNAVSRETLLTVEIFINQYGYLVVQNNLNPKKNREAGAGMGLQNIVNRYNLLSNKRVQVNNTGQHFIVLLPILKK
jgi:ligand-binding sensor domain-containing protein